MTWNGANEDHPGTKNTRTVLITVHGDPAPQGSKRAARNKHSGKIAMIESSKRVKPWRQDVRHAVESQAPDARYTGPVGVTLIFTFPRPKGHYRTGRNAHLLRDQAPAYPSGRTNDVDKLARSTLDALTSSGIIDDDGQVALLHARKVYVGHPAALDRPGATITLSALEAAGNL